jgi:signal transduction histidine kinase/CheY-like chemotaxis protein
MKRKKWTIATIIILILLITVSCVLWIFASVLIRNEKAEGTKQLQTKIDIYTNQLSKVLSTPLWNFDNLMIEEIIKNYMNDKELYTITLKESDNNKYIIIISRDNKWNIITARSIPLHGYDIIKQQSTIIYNNKIIGEVSVYLTTKFSNNKIRNRAIYIILISLLLETILIVTLYFTFWIIIIKPVKIINQFSKSVIENEHQALSIKFPKILGEISNLYATINQMVDILYQRHVNYQIIAQKFKILFEKSPISILLEDVSEIITHFKKLKENNISNLDVYMERNSEEFYMLLSKIQIIEVNQAACVLFEVPGENEITDCKSPLLTEILMPFYKESLQILWDGLNSYRGEFEIKTLNGRFKYVIAKWNLIETSQQKNFLLVSITDITERKNIELILIENERELKFKNEEYFTLNEELSESNERILKINEELVKAKEKAEESDKLKGAFLDNLSHEIRTPLNAIIGFSDLLQEKSNMDSKTNNYISIIQLSSQQLLAIVSDVLTISRIQTGQETMCVNPVTVASIFDNLFELYKEAAYKKSLKFNYNKDTNKSEIQILTDESKVTSIIGAFLSNAIKFTQTGQIELGYEVKERFIIIYVKDTGIGISKGDIPYIFDRFRQANKDISVNYGGTGLGLSIAKAYSEMLGGNISVTSRISKGTTFTFTMPYVAFETEETAVNNGAKNLEHKKTILIAEDEFYNYQLIESMLEEQNMQLIKASNGSEALEICRNNDSIDLVLMDIKMPIMDGVSAFKEIRKFRKNLPVIAQTAYDVEQENLHLIQNGFNDFLTKPIKKKKLLETIFRYTK